MPSVLLSLSLSLFFFPFFFYSFQSLPHSRFTVSNALSFRPVRAFRRKLERAEYIPPPGETATARITDRQDAVSCKGLKLFSRGDSHQEVDT